MRRSLFLVMISLSNSLFAQNEAAHWYFGTNASLDFTSGSPIAGSGSLATSEGTASISYANGDLMFYTNGVEVYDSTHSIMSNGLALKGDVSTTHSAMIVPFPGNATQFYIFTAAADGGPNGFCYSIVDMTMNSGLGAVTLKNVFLTDSIVEKIAAIKDPNSRSDSYWVVTHKYGTNQFLSYKVTDLGIDPPVVTSVGTIHNTSTFQNTYGQMKFNMCGDKLALALGYMNQAEIYDFNINTGVVSNPILLPMNDHVYGIEFSPSSDYLFLTCYDPSVSLSQFDLTFGTESLIQASETYISSTSDLYGLQLGPDGKIYVSRSFTSSYLGVINSPEIYGSGCNYVDNAIDLDPNFNGYNGGLSLTSFMQSYLGTGTNCVLPNGVVESESSKEYEIFPNPSSEGFYFGSDYGNYQLELFDITGKKLFSKNDLSNFRFGMELSKGIYFLSVARDDKLEIIKLIRD